MTQDHTKKMQEWGNYGSPERLALRELLEAYRKNPSNANRHEQAIVDFISDTHAHVVTETEKRVLQDVVELRRMNGG